MRTILVADDDAGFRELVSELLGDAGYRVLKASDGAEAWELLESSGADMAVLDLNMPRLDGLQLTQRIRAHPSYAAMPIMMMTIRELAQDQASGYDHGADEYLPKPFDHRVFIAKVRALERRLLA